MANKGSADVFLRLSVLVGVLEVAYISFYNIDGVHQNVQIVSASYLFLIYSLLLLVKWRPLIYFRWFLIAVLILYTLYGVVTGFPLAPIRSRFSL